MEMIYLVGVIVVAFLFYFFSKSRSIGKKASVHENKNEPDKKYIKPPIEMSKEPGRNSWLYPNDDFGKMEEGKSDVEIKYTPKR